MNPRGHLVKTAKLIALELFGLSGDDKEVVKNEVIYLLDRDRFLCNEDGRQVRKEDVWRPLANGLRPCNALS
jgi:hypothetical protein